jgi:hypothetical protein
MELYWHIKTFLGQMLQTLEYAQNTIHLQLMTLHLLMREILNCLSPSSTNMLASVPKGIAPIPEPP